MFYNNVRVGKGALLSVSASIQIDPNLEAAQTPYSFARMNDEKERAFEEIRQQYFPTAPPRLKAFYVFDELKLAERAKAGWFLNDPKDAHECNVLTSSVVHRADTIWLNYRQDQWSDYARKYWSGTMSANAFPEVLVHGALYFPRWREFPIK